MYLCSFRKFIYICVFYSIVYVIVVYNANNKMEIGVIEVNLDYQPSLTTMQNIYLLENIIMDISITMKYKYRSY